MKSKASTKGHPIHPILVTFPIAFFAATLFFDIAGSVCDKPGFFQTARYLNVAGIISALVAAVPGLIDYLGTIPPASSAKKRGTQHGLLNVTVVIIFFIAFMLKRSASSITVIIILETIGVLLLGVAGWMGGTLVYRNQVGVYNRYADKGEWDESNAHQTKGKIEIEKANELKVDQMKLIHAGDRRIVVGRTKNGFVAFDDHCTHKGGSLMGGVLICETVQCPWHGSQFDVTTGAVKAGPAKESIKTYRIELENDKVYLLL